MCGRFAQALPPRDYLDNIDEQMHRRRGGGGRRAERREQENGEQQKESSSSQKTNDSSSGSQRAAAPQQSQNDDDPAMQNADLQSLVAEDDYHPTHNVAPGVRVPIVRLQDPVPFPGGSSGGGDSSEKQEGRARSDTSSSTVLIQCMRWGLLPHYTTFIPRGPDAMRTINARDDAVLSGRSMWTPLLRSGKRCVVFAQGFFEWLKKDDGATRIAHFVGMKQDGQGRTDAQGQKRALMPMAGLWERCELQKEGGKEEMYSFTIITTESNKQLNFLHDRMPVILPDAHAIQVWLGLQPDATTDEICSLLKPYDAGELDCYPVPREVGKVGTDNANFILPISTRKDGIAAAFDRQKKTQSKDAGDDVSSTKTKDANSETNAPMDQEIKAADQSASYEQHKAAAKRKREEEEAEDARLARKMQADEEKRAWQESRQRQREHEQKQNEIKEEEQPKEGLRSDSSEADDKVQQQQKKRQRQPSTRFSPEPWNPPVSPERPRGGWSTEENNDPSPYKRSPAAAKRAAAASGPAGSQHTTPSKKQLQEAAKGTKDIRSFFGK